MKLFAWGVVPLRAGLHAYGVLSLVASVAWIKRGSHETCHRGAIVFATHVIRPLGDLFCAVSGVGWIPHGPCAPEGSRSDNGQLPAREGAKAQRRKDAAPQRYRLVRAQTNTTLDQSTSGSGENYMPNGKLLETIYYPITSRNQALHPAILTGITCLG